VLLSHADRTRIVSDDHRKRVIARNAPGFGSILVDGFGRGIWRIERRAGTATLRIEPFEPLRKQDRAVVAEEGARLLGFAAADVKSHDVQFAAVGQPGLL
jgi:hypothetical protein